jgi:tetratricopeptide (TPR) repeat protein
MDWVGQAAGWLRDVLAQPWLDAWEPTIAATPDWALVAIVPALLVILLLLTIVMGPRGPRKPRTARAMAAAPSPRDAKPVASNSAPKPAPANTSPARVAPPPPTKSPTPTRVLSPSSANTPEYDIFLSYARKDNVASAPDGEGWVTAFHRRLIAQHERYAGRPLKVFFDKEDITSDEDWERRIYRGLRSSSLFVAFLSPNYLASPVCRREWDEYLRLEHTLARGDDGIKQVYFADIPDLFGDDASLAKFDEDRRAWVSDMRRRNLHHSFDLRPWIAGGAQQLQELDAEKRIAELRANPKSDHDRSIVSLADQIAAIDRAIAQRLDAALLANLAPGNLDASYANFVGRSRELRQMHSALIADKVGSVCALYGLGGQGKSALAVQYAYAYAGSYAAGGRWLLPCEGKTHLADALEPLIALMGLQPPEPPKGVSDDEARAFVVKSVADALEQRIDEAAPLIAEKLAKRPDAQSRPEDRPQVARRVLLILDNVDHAALLSAEEMQSLAGRPWLQIVATTRLDPNEFGADSMTAIPVDNLPMDDALALLRGARPFADDAEAQAARRIVELLGGFTLGIELVGAFLADRKEVSYQSYLVRLEAEGLSGTDALASDARTAARIRHREKQIGRVVDDTLAALPAAAREILGCAALFPPDQIVSHWLRSVVSEALPQMSEDKVKPGHPDPWEEMMRELAGRRLLPPAPTSEDQYPQLRMHRLVGQHLVAISSTEELDVRWARVIEKLGELAELVEVAWEHLPDAAVPMVGPYAALVELTHRERNNRETALALSTLSLIELQRGSIPRARSLAEAAFATHERIAAENPKNAQAQRDLAMICDRLGEVATNAGDLAQARARYEQMSGVLERLAAHTPESAEAQRDLEVSLNRLGDVALDAGDLAEAGVRYEQSFAIAARLAARDPDDAEAQRDLLRVCDRLGEVAMKAGDLVQARVRYEQSFTIAGGLAAPNPSNVATPSDIEYPERAEALLDLSRGLFRLTEVAREAGDLAAVRARYEQSFVVAERLAAQNFNSAEAQRNIAESLVLLGRIARNAGDLAQARARYEQSLAIDERIAAENPESAQAQRDLSMSLERLGDLAEQAGDLTEAIRRYEQSLPIARTLAASYPDHPKFFSDAAVTEERLETLRQRSRES